MQKHQFRLLPCRFQRRFQPQQLPVEHLLVVSVFIFVQEPAPGTAEGIAAVLIAVIVEQVQRFEAVLLTKAVSLVGCRPPVVVIPLDDQLAAGKGVKERKVLA